MDHKVINKNDHLFHLDGQFEIIINGGAFEILWKSVTLNSILIKESAVENKAARHVRPFFINWYNFR